MGILTGFLYSETSRYDTNPKSTAAIRIWPAITGRFSESLARISGRAYRGRCGTGPTAAEYSPTRAEGDSLRRHSDGRDTPSLVDRRVRRHVHDFSSVEPIVFGAVGHVQLTGHQQKNREVARKLMEIHSVSIFKYKGEYSPIRQKKRGMENQYLL